MVIFYDDQMTVGNTWPWYVSIIPMISNLIFASWCATLGPVLWIINKNNTKYRYCFWIVG